MRIYTRAGDLAFRTFTFPDGQPHFSLETYEREFQSVTIEVALRSGSDLLLTVLASDTLRQHGYSEVNLDIRYLLGARMDRAISVSEPFTLQSIARIVNSCGFSQVRLLDAHSEVATRLIRNSVNLLPHTALDQVLATLRRPVIVVPDKGAVGRTAALTPGYDKVFCEKTRDMSTGKLTGFVIKDPFYIMNEHLSDFLIVDDICDGGGTFSGIAAKIREIGPRKVSLFVTHGVFSKDLPIPGIDHVFTTNSYCNWDVVGTNPVWDARKIATIIPVSMKEMK